MIGWRVGKKLGRTLYLDDACVGMVDTPELAKRIVDSMNSFDEMVRLARAFVRSRAPATSAMQTASFHAGTNQKRTKRASRTG